MTRRMFSTDIVESDAFLDMPLTTQALYFHLAMRADDDGFVNPKMVMRMLGSVGDDIKVLISKRFVLPFESGVVVIKHWLIHNRIRSDGYKETPYLDEKNTIGVKENGAYTELRDGIAPIQRPTLPKWLQIRRGQERPASGPQTAHRLGKVRLGKVSTEGESTPPEAPEAKVIEPKGKTPVEVNRCFFARGPEFRTIAAALCEKIPEALVNRELEKFILYWTEPNKSGTKVRWEQQTTFDVKLRLRTWLMRVKDYSAPMVGNKRGYVL